VTLIELLLVISILAMLAVFTWPTFEATAQHEQLSESVRRLKTLVAMCRAEAMSDMRCYRITFRQDGSMKLRQQLDPIAHPEVFIPVQKDWANLAFLLEDVWIESICPLPDGPPPVQVQDELMVFEDMQRDFEPIEIEKFDHPIDITFSPDGTSKSLRWTMRDQTGRAFQMTLDGRLGRVAIEDVASLKPDDVERPPDINRDQEAEQERMQWEEAGWEPPKP
jgi:Tfp pilus assembly protein FimT